MLVLADADEVGVPVDEDIDGVVELVDEIVVLISFLWSLMLLVQSSFFRRRRSDVDSCFLMSLTQSVVGTTHALIDGLQHTSLLRRSDNAWNRFSTLSPTDVRSLVG